MNYRALQTLSHAKTGEIVKRGDIKPRAFWDHRTDFEMKVMCEMGLIEIVKEEKLARKAKTDGN